MNHMKRIIWSVRNVPSTLRAGIWLPACGILLACQFMILFPVHAGPENSTKLTIIHFNDAHAHYVPFTDSGCHDNVGGFARFKSLIDQVTENRKNQGRKVLTLFAGDLLTGTTYSNKFKGALGIDLLNKMNLAAMTVGNHEFDYGFNNLKDQMEPLMDFPLLSANIIYDDGKPAFKGIIEQELADGAGKLVILGLTTDLTPEMTAPGNCLGLEFKDPIKVARLKLKDYSEEDLIIALTHLGVNYDRELALSCPKIDLIVGGHSHTTIIQPQNLGATLIVQAGAFTRYLGILDLDVEDGGIKNYAAQLKPMDADLPMDKGFEQIIAKYTAKLPGDLAKVLGESEIALDAGVASVRSNRNSEFGKLVTGMMVKKTRADVGLINGGSIRKSICPGKITLQSLEEALPYENKIYVVELKGEDLLAAMEKSFSENYGSGAKLQRFGLEIEVANGNHVIKSVGGKEFRKDAVYKIALNDFIAKGGDGYTVFYEKGQSLKETDLEVRASLAEYITENGPVNKDLIENPR